MAIKMMALNTIDKQFIDDNMLTDEDFRYDTEEFEISYEDQNIFESFASDIQMLSADLLLNTNPQPVQQAAMCADLNQLLRGYVGLNYEVEPPSSPNSSVSSEVYSTDNEISVISIPDIANDVEVTTILTDTPPHTPPGSVDLFPSSPISCEPIVTVNSLNGVTYAVPQNTQAVNGSAKYNMKNIQPKMNINAKPIVLATANQLTSEEMKKIANGTLPQLRGTSSHAAIPFPKGLQNNRQLLNSLVSKQSTKKGKKDSSSLSSLEICALSLKIQEKKMKNRESAYLSRKRKKEHVEKLEYELLQLSAENSSLKEENSRLKLKISDLEKEIQRLKVLFSPKNVKKTLGLMAVLCMLTLNLAPYSSVFDNTASKVVKVDPVDHRVGRTLLWNGGNTTEEIKEPKVVTRRLRRHIKEEDLESSYIVDFEQNYNSSTCQHFINKTESLRLENDLLGWVERVEKKRTQSKSKKRKFNLDKALPHLATLSRRRAGINQDIWARKKNKNEILIYETPRKAYEDFFDAIHRRDDTFYFVSFSGDHLLLPAIANNKTLRPRMSFVMPAMTLNESVGDSDEHISMMQIDCEVMDTKLVHIRESVIPEHLRQKQNQTHKTHPQNSSDVPTGHTRRLHSTNKIPKKSRTTG